MIVSFADTDSEKVWNGQFSRKLPPDIQRTARRKMIQIHGSRDVQDLKIPPGNRLHELSGDRDGQYSISINRQWRICFYWSDGNAHEVEIVDYH